MGSVAKERDAHIPIVLRREMRGMPKSLAVRAVLPFLSTVMLAL